MTNASIEVKIGELSFSGSGSEEWLSEKLDGFIDRLPEIVCSLPKSKVLPSEINKADVVESVAQKVDAQKASNDLPSMSVNTIATRLNANGCKDVAFSAIVQLSFFQGKETFTYDEIRSEMKNATSVYNSNMTGSNLKNAIQSLIKEKKINECSTKVYALRSDTLNEVQLLLVA